MVCVTAVFVFIPLKRNGWDPFILSWLRNLDSRQLQSFLWYLVLFSHLHGHYACLHLSLTHLILETLNFSRTQCPQLVILLPLNQSLGKSTERRHRDAASMHPQSLDLCCWFCKRYVLYEFMNFLSLCQIGDLLG